VNRVFGIARISVYFVDNTLQKVVGTDVKRKI